VIIFYSVRFLSKKVTESNFFKKKTETEPKPGQTDRFRFGSVFLGQKPVQTGLARFWLGFFWFGSVFFRVFFCFGSVRFFAYKTETEPAGFFKILIGYFFFIFSVIFFSGFLSLTIIISLLL
jgi:hypothetical protein